MFYQNKLSLRHLFLHWWVKKFAIVVWHSLFPLLNSNYQRQDKYSVKQALLQMNSSRETTKQMELLIFLVSYLIRTAIPHSSLGTVKVTSVFNFKPQRTKKCLTSMMLKYSPSYWSGTIFKENSDILVLLLSSFWLSSI